MKARKKMRLEKTYKSFSELKKHLKSNDHDTLTFAVDQILLTANTLAEIQAKIEKLKSNDYTESNDFKNLTIIKKHIRYRQTHNKIVFSMSKANKLRMINLDYENIQEKLF